MYSSDSDSDFDEDLQFLIALKLLEGKKKMRRWWVHPINRGRQAAGEFHRLVKELESDEEKFYQYFRMNKAQYEEVHSLIEGDIKKVHTRFREPIGTKERLALCLRFLATGNTFRSLAFNYRMGFATVRVIVQEVCEAIWKNMAPIVMPTPSEQMWKDIANNFKQLWHFPNCIGALDGKHVNIICPINAGSTFYNYKQVHSIVLLALVDAQYKFIMIDVGAYGRNSDGGIYDKSWMGRLFEQKAFNVPQDEPLSQSSQPMPYTIIADDAAFPLKTYLLKPYPKDKLVNNDANKIFNYRLSRARRCVENAFGILRARFRVFHGPMQVQPDMVDKIVLASCCLHNFLRTHTSQTMDDPKENVMDSTDHSSNSDCLLNIEGLPRNPSKNAVYVREKYKEYFISQEGSVPWQMEMIRRGRLNNSA